MSLTSIDYVIFLSLLFLFYWMVAFKSLRIQNLLLLVVSYYFYAQWGIGFIFILIFSTLFNFIVGKKIHKSQKIGSSGIYWLYFGLILNVGLLGFFKIPGLLLHPLMQRFLVLPFFDNSTALSLVAPIGVSFYIFCGIAYLIDIFRKRIQPSEDYLEYSLFIGFFPVITAGPIERASHLLPQIRKLREFSNGRAVDGLKQILWGVFKKIVIADGCADYVNTIFGNTSDYSGSTLLLGAIMFSFQIYADFSGYSDMVLGSARLLGIELTQNFSFPYFSRDIAEFWRRWHMSLSSWFRDYVFYPLERHRLPFLGQGLNTVIVFLLTGLWHGFNWTFLIWGGLNAVYFLLFLYASNKRNAPAVVAQGKYFPSIREVVELSTTFGLVTFTWIFFRAPDLRQAMSYISSMFSWSIFSIPEILPIKLLVLMLFFVVLEWIGREQKYALAQMGLGWPRPLRWAFYYLIIFVVFYFSGTQQQFIYSQF